MFGYKCFVILYLIAALFVRTKGFIFKDSVSTCKTRTNITDHIIFEYEVTKNGTIVSSLKIPETLPHLVVDPPVEHPYFNTIGLCLHQTRHYFVSHTSQLGTLTFIDNRKDLVDSNIKYDRASLKITIRYITSSTDYQIFDALKDDNIELVRQLISSSVGVNAVDEYGLSPLMVAIINNKERVILELLNAMNPTADLNMKTPAGYTALFYAVENSSSEITRLLLERGADPNAHLIGSGRGNTPLHHAVLLEKTDHIMALLSAGAQTDARNSYDQTPLSMLSYQAPALTKTLYKDLLENARAAQIKEL